MRVFLMFCALFLSACGDIPCEKKPVIAVYPYWKHSEHPLNTLKWERFSHIAIFTAFPSPNGTLVTEQIDKFVPDLVRTAHAQNKKVVLAIGGAGRASKSFLEITMNEAKTARFTEAVKAYIEKHQIDGVDIDWEYWTFQSEQKKAGMTQTKAGAWSSCSRL